ncbi:MAG: 50S ribosomal protein L2 [Candidatus Yanofskybacteria bacterium RIFCSPHIGHO2_02_FULL_43_15c]|uniref:Large ribosomal subunit protein uL2 n=2 Tax=Candidatus Yanofskyibacteriota TaxID=1752733 RepID=A0A1F8H0G4_9BACT|nr:MAG: 50S ribosomal protein L2 [Candidatus Yanofskybacteria bacterium RIFCSPHIGHO2_02_FULL_43_15c]OGN30750.1 MAG: 50S ribosomal protein L2 [Candidatus Yanofskybacteria bacterium RIFCSPLOWO2_02_FULL_43_10b]
MSKKYRPTTASRRHMEGYDFSNLSKIEPLKSKTHGFRRLVGRGNTGLITVRHKGGGVKRLYREIDFRQDKKNIPGKVFSIEYDPNRTARIARIHYADGDKRYILAPENLKAGDTVISADRVSLKPGHRAKLRNIPQGTEIYNIEIFPGRPGSLVRSAGSKAVVMSKDAGYVQVQLPSSELRKFLEDSMASIGRLSNLEHSSITIGKAGRSRHKGIRPSVRGSAMNPVDHPHGGGEGAQPIGLTHPKTPWGKHALGVRTRGKKKRSWKFIVRRRKK